MKEVIAENYLCFLALIEMIIQDVIGTNCIDQFYLAEYFGVTVPKDYKIGIKNVQYSDRNRQLGVHINENKLNILFQNAGIPLYTDYIYVNPFEGNKIDDYRYPNIRSNKYVVYTYSYGYLYDIPKSYDIGHVALLDKVISQSCLRIYDPGPQNHGYKEVNRFEMYEAMRIIKSGIYVFETNI